MTDRREHTRDLIVTRAQVSLKIRNWAEKNLSDLDHRKSEGGYCLSKGSVLKLPSLNTKGVSAVCGPESQAHEILFPCFKHALAVCTFLKLQLAHFTENYHQCLFKVKCAAF